MVVGRVLTLLGLKIGGYDLGKVVFVVGDAIFFFVHIYKYGMEV